MVCDDPVLVLCRARLRRQRRWLYGGFLLIYSLLLVQGATPAIALLFAPVLVLVSFLPWLMTSTLQSLVKGGALQEMQGVGLGIGRVLDSLSAYGSRLAIPSVLLAGVGLVLTYPAWMEPPLHLFVPAAACYVALSLVSLRDWAYWSAAQATSTSMGRLLLLQLKQTLLFLPIAGLAICACLPGLNLETRVLLVLGAMLSGWLVSSMNRRAVLAFVEEGLQPKVRRPRRRQGAQPWSEHPLVYRYSLSRPSWRGRPASEWLAGTFGLGWTLAFAWALMAGYGEEAHVLLALAGYLALFQAAHCMLSVVGSLQAESTQRTLEPLLAASAPGELVDAAAQVGYRPRSRELFLMTGGVTLLLPWLGLGLTLSWCAALALVFWLYRAAAYLGVALVLYGSRRGWTGSSLWGGTLVLAYATMFLALLTSGGVAGAAQAAGLDAAATFSTVMATWLIGFALFPRLARWSAIRELRP